MFHILFAARQASAVIHTHSKAAVMATLLYPGKEFRVTHLEMIKVIQASLVIRDLTLRVFAITRFREKKP